MFAVLTLTLTLAFGAGQDITIPSGKETIKAYIAIPEKEGKHPAVVVVHEWWGLNDQIKGAADRLAKAGYVAIVPDLYRGKVGQDAESAHELMRGLPEERAVADIKATADFLGKHERVAGKSFGVVGFCMGGRLSLLSAIDDSRFQATVLCYGRPETDPEKLNKLAGPVLAIFGGADNGIGPEQHEAFRQGMEKAVKKLEIKVYDGAGHAFMNEKGRNYKEEATTDAWKHILEFFDKSLRPPSKS